MTSPQTALEKALEEVDRLRNIIGRVSSTQVKTSDERSIAKANALSWFNTHRPFLVDCVGDSALTGVDAFFNEILGYAERNTTRSRYLDTLKTLRRTLLELRSANIVALSKASPKFTPDKPPDFSALVADEVMRNILVRRWTECTICVQSAAPLAATVMMGGLLETLLLTRIQLDPEKAKIFKSKLAPKGIDGKVLPLGEWTLKSYIDVAHELGWITQTEKDIGVVLRDYRNYIHPYKERSHGIELKPNDSLLLWELSKNICIQLLRFSRS